jgi:putative SOS response-associated peptidase YedK
VTKGQQAIRELAGVMRDRTGNLPLMLGIYPDYRAPVVRNEPEGRELTMARWGMPSPLASLKGRNSAHLQVTRENAGLQGRQLL